MSIHDFEAITGHDRTDRLQTRLAAAKRAFTTRNVDLAQAARMVRSGRRPQAGDLILARVTALGQHRRIDPAGRINLRDFAGDLQCQPLWPGEVD